MVYCACDTNKKDKQVLTQNLLIRALTLRLKKPYVSVQIYVTNIMSYV